MLFLLLALWAPAAAKTTEASKDAEITALREAIDAFQDAIESKDKQIAALEAAIESKEAAIESLEAALASAREATRFCAVRVELCTVQVASAERLATASQELYLKEAQRNNSLKPWQKNALVIGGTALAGAFVYEVWIDRD